MIFKAITSSCQCTFMLLALCRHILVIFTMCMLSVCRYCLVSNTLLPVPLQSWAVLPRPHGLRARVIRSLYHVYRPLSQRTVNHSNNTNNSSHLCERFAGLRCVSAWQERAAKPHWKFYFKFRRGSGRPACPLSGSGHDKTGSGRGLLAPADVLYNPEERCTLLVVTTPHFLPLPLVMGQVLIRAAVTGSIFTQSLKLTFSPEFIIQPKSRSAELAAGAVLAQFDGFVSARILDWWHPNYPHRR